MEAAERERERTSERERKRERESERETSSWLAALSASALEEAAACSSSSELRSSAPNCKLCRVVLKKKNHYFPEFSFRSSGLRSSASNCKLCRVVLEREGGRGKE